MTNRIRKVEIRPHSLVPAEAELRLAVTPEHRTPTTEVRGRLMGPACLFASTIEVAYHFRPLPGPPQASGDELAVRALIPEASLWEPACPHLYHGPVELWEEGRRCDRVTVRCGLRTLNLGPRGLRVNGRVLILHGREVTECSDEQGLELRQAGVNLLVVPLEPGNPDRERVWESADRLGFLVLGRLPAGSDYPAEGLATLATHPSCLGWLTASGQKVPEGLPPEALVGLETKSTPPESLPPGISFAVLPSREQRSVSYPHLVRDTFRGTESQAVTRGPLLGSIDPAR